MKFEIRNLLKNWEVSKNYKFNDNCMYRMLSIKNHDEKLEKKNTAKFALFLRQI